MAATTSDDTQPTPIPKDFPPVVYLPCTEHVTEPSEATVEMRRARDGRMCLLAYSALDRLKYCCGEHQPWMVLPTPYLDQLQQAQPFELLLLDVVIPEDHRHGAGDG